MAVPVFPKPDPWDGRLRGEAPRDPLTARAAGDWREAPSGAPDGRAPAPLDPMTAVPSHLSSTLRCRGLFAASMPNRPCDMRSSSVVRILQREAAGCLRGLLTGPVVVPEALMDPIAGAGERDPHRFCDYGHNDPGHSLCGGPSSPYAPEACRYLVLVVA
ncbi:hypothetical protein GCM10009753_17730 [Streptantibioticus ferralitis]